MSSISPPPQESPMPGNSSDLPPIITDGTAKRPSGPRWPSYSKNRLSTYSNVSFGSQNRSRPGSHVFPVFHSSLSYALVRDFAYPAIHPLHYGPLPHHASGISTPGSECRRLSDPPAPWDSSRGQWSAATWGSDNSHNHQQLPAMSFGDGPPYSEDEDLFSPVVITPYRRKNKTPEATLSKRKSNVSGVDSRGVFVGTDKDGGETYYVGNEEAVNDGPGGEFVTYPASECWHYQTEADPYRGRSAYGPEGFHDPEDDIANTGRYSRDYQFAIGCPDEEMHGKAVALFDFVREHENELPLTEGQVIFVSYRHGQGWLVAEDPKTGESGLVPEEFVRLLREIEGGLTSLNDNHNPNLSEDNTCRSPESLTPDGEPSLDSSR